MSALIKAFLTIALLALVSGPVFAAGFNNLEIDATRCLSATEVEEIMVSREPDCGLRFGDARLGES